MAGKFDSIFNKDVSATSGVSGTFGNIFEGVPRIDYAKRVYDPTGLLTDRATSRLAEPLIKPETTKEIFKEDIKQTFTGTLEALTKIRKDPLGVSGIGIGDATKTFKDAGKTALSTLIQSGQDQNKRAAEFIGSFGKEKTLADKIGAGLKFTAGAGGVMFSPISAIFAGAEKLPVLGTIAKGFSVPFLVAGEAGAKATENAVNALPISEEAKGKIMEGAKEVGSLATQLLTGRAIKVGTDKIKEIKQKYGEQDAQVIIHEAERVAQEQTTKKQGITEVQTTEGKFDTVFQEKRVEVKPTISEQIIGKPELPIIEGTGEVKPRGLSLGVEEKAIESGLTKGFSELPEYAVVNMADQATKAHALLTSNYEQARRIALGQETPPPGIIPEAVLVAVENRAILESDINLLRDLATTSRLTAEATAMGQRIRTLAERNTESPVGAIEDIIQTREALIKSKVKDVPKAKKAEVEKIETEMRKVKVPKETWASFVESLKC